jgi:hypothetical protein
VEGTAARKVFLESSGLFFRRQQQRKKPCHGGAWRASFLTWRTRVGPRFSGEMRCYTSFSACADGSKAGPQQYIAHTAANAVYVVGRARM